MLMELHHRRSQGLEASGNKEEGSEGMKKGLRERVERRLQRAGKPREQECWAKRNCPEQAAPDSVRA